jgi:carboxyl-terminal processing protease
MKSALAFLLILLTCPAFAQDNGRDRLNPEMANAVFVTALEFIAPRALEPVTIQQLASWGLSGMTALDPTLSPGLAGGNVILRRANAVLFQRAAPAENNSEGWGTVLTDLAAAAYAASPGLQAEGGQSLINGFFDALFNHLDPYSRYVPPEAADEDRARRSGEAGAGLVLSRTRGGFFAVQTVNADGPAAEAGIVPGDQVTAVDDQPTRGEELDTVMSWITGVEGTDVVLTVRSRRGRMRKVEIERAVLPPETVFTSRAGDAVLIRIAGFSSDTDQRFTRDIQRQLAGPGAAALRGVIIDLRGNRGGLLRQAVAATDILLEHGVIATASGRNAQAEHEWRASDGDLLKGRPIVILIDGRSASAAEIMAAALQDQGRGVVVGSSSLGKGLIQTVTTLPDGGELFVSWSRVLAPRGWPIQGLGVLPQICTSLGDDRLSAQLESLERGTLPLAPALAQREAARPPLSAGAIVQERMACPAAEGREADLATARWLLGHPAAYGAALLTPPPP